MKTHTTAERLKQIASERGLRQIDILELCKPLCQKFNVKIEKNDLSQYMKGLYEPRQNKLTILALALDVSEVWLMGYDVPMERVEHIKSAPATTLDERLALFNQLSPEKQEQVLEYMEFLIATSKKE